MKALTVTQELKNLNIDFFKYSQVGDIKVFDKIPKSFYSLNYNNGQRTDGYNTLDNSIHVSDGFYDLIIPVEKIDYFKETQKLGAIYFDEIAEVFKYEIIDLDQTELDKIVKDEFKNNLEGVFAYATTPDGTKEYAIKIGNDGKISTTLIP